MKKVTTGTITKGEVRALCAKCGKALRLHVSGLSTADVRVEQCKHCKALNEIWGGVRHDFEVFSRLSEKQERG